MGLSCNCDCEWEMELGDWAYWGDDEIGKTEFEKLKTTRRKRCCSCSELIDLGALCIVHGRFRQPYTEIEARIYGVDHESLEEPPIRIANHYQCEKCAEIWLNLISIGYECLSPSENMPEALKDYQVITGFKKVEA